MELLYSAKSTMDTGYKDFLHEVKQLGYFGSVTFSRDIYTPERCRNKIDRTPDDIWKSVLDADRVQWITSTMAREEGRERKEILQEASKILQEMAYKEQLNLVRVFGFTMYHVMNKIYTGGVWYNTDTLKSIREAVREHPVILMPSHRCYMDFLVLSVLSVHIGLPLPAIASGMDFMTMKGIGFLLRSSGAFFMRRSFGSDKLYWALFTEYVHSLIINCDRTIEFFIEGTRSRSGKSLNPKLGLLSVVAEPYLKAQIYDIKIVPVSISYDRILEDSLYAHELLGVPKPKESTSGLFKATSILEENYGSLHVHFASPISIRNEFAHLDRAVHACYPRYMLRLTTKEQNHLIDLAYRIVQIQQKNMILGLWPFIATILSHSPNGIEFKSLVYHVQNILDVLRTHEVKIKLPNANLVDAAKQTLHKYRHIVVLESKNSEDIYVSIKHNSNTSSFTARSDRKLTSLHPAMRDKAAVHLLVASYRNQLIHIFVKPALVVGAMPVRQQGIDLNSKAVKENFAFLREVFYSEFIFPPNHLDKDYNEGIAFLVEAGIASRDGNCTHFHSKGTRLVTFLLNLLRPFFRCYIMICNYLSEFHQASEMKELCNSIQLWIAKQIGDDVSLLETLSKDMISNGVQGMERVGVVRFSKESEKKVVHVRRIPAKSVGERMQLLMEGQRTTFHRGYPDQNSKL